MATHHGLRSVNNIPRNMPDDLLKKLAAKGGVIGFQIGNEFHNREALRVAHEARRQGVLGHHGDRASRRRRLTIEEIDRMVAPQFPMVGQPTCPRRSGSRADEWVAVVDRAIQLVGEDHVALGTDFDGGPTLPRGMRDIRDLPMITDAMLRRGWSGGAHPQVPGRQPAARVPPDHRETKARPVNAAYRTATRSLTVAAL